ncbi:DUF1772 domain-containing protein [Streptomyces sp. NPDC001922]|uniref:anthrone oxygenase family protein n=1 Tax=Streptomyces sp. NPDC001922 TaxID=3364624 RepID=UPI0036CE691A
MGSLPSTGYSLHAGPAGRPARLSNRPSGLLLRASALFTGLMAGLFFAFDISVMPGLARLDDVAYAEAMQHFNAVIDGSPLFRSAFLAAPACTLAAAVRAHRGGCRPLVLPLVLAGLCYLAMVVLTVTVNLPLNDELAALGDPAAASDLSVVERFRTVWGPVNVARTVLCVISLGTLCSVLIRHGRLSVPGQ